MTARDPQVLREEQADAAAPVRLEPAEPLRVPFAGGRGGDGPLTLGQASTLEWVTNPSFYTRMTEWPLTIPPGTALDDIAAVMAVLMARHESLRTTFPAVRPPLQRVARTGELVIDVYEADGDATDRAALTVPLTRLLRSREFDLTVDLPLRMAIAAWHGEPRAAVIVYSHMAVDFASMALIDREFTALLSDPGHQPSGHQQPRHQPLDQAADERSARGVRRNEAALRSWEAQLRAMPQHMYAVPLDDAGPAGGSSGWLWSRAAALALPHVAARTEVSRQTVVFAALCTMLAWRTGHAECILPVAATNRYQRHLGGYVGPLAQDCMMSVDTRAGGLDEVVSRTAAAAVRGYRNGLVQITTLRSLFQRVEQDRGIICTRHCTFNDLSRHLGDTGEAAPCRDPGEARLALAGTRFATLAAPPIEEALLLMLQQVSGELIVGGLTRDASLLPAGEIETLLRGTESLIVAAAPGDIDLGRLAEITGVRPVERGAGWLHVDRSWVRLDDVGRLLADALPAPSAAFAVRDHDSVALVAYLAASDAISSPGQAHEACMKALREPDCAGRARHAAMAPGRYVICARSPADPGDLASWQHQPVIADGTGRVRTP